MKYLKLFEDMENPYDKFIDYLTYFMDEKFTIHFGSLHNYEPYIKIVINYNKTELYRNRGRNILGIFDTNDVQISNRNIGLIYSKMKKTDETIELVDMISDCCLKIANLTDKKEGYFILDDNCIVIYFTLYDGF